MSKASEYKAAVEALPSPGVHAFGRRFRMCVGPAGQLNISYWDGEVDATARINAEDALALAEWILDTFGDPDTAVGKTP